MTDAFRRNVAVATASLLASSATLVCCVLPAALVSLGAGAALVGLVTAVPQLVWLSQHKDWVFGGAAVMLAVSGILIWNARRLPCPVEPSAARACARLRRMSTGLFMVAVALFLVGAAFAYPLQLTSH